VSRVSLRKDTEHGGLHQHDGGRPPFGRLLVANRGEIALRVIRACRELGVESVAVYSDADEGARHTRAADIAVRIGPASPTESYLAGDRIVATAVETGAHAIHPGYGFLSEQAEFGRLVEAAGLTFVGPEPRTLESLGDKLAARRSAQQLDVPIVPGTFEPLSLDGPDSLAVVERAADAIGYPLMIKAAAGGGGRGMRRVDHPRELPLAAAGAAREAEQAFADSRVYLERYVEGARHVEVQLLGDSHGTVVALGDRDCSVQRRHQKLVEEGPAPGITRDERMRLHDLAVRIAQSVGLRNAATAEFLLDRDGEFRFLEVNARLQVEHGVTELVSGIDLVHQQLWVAAGHPLTDEVRFASDAAADPPRHAIELRISAEDPGHAFAPRPGVLARWREPGGPGVRMDSGVEEGSRVSGDYDPLLAKLLVVAPDRAQAIARARRAIDEFEIGGLQTTLPFHRWLLRHPTFVSADLRTNMVDQEWDPAQERESAARRAATAVALTMRAGSATSDERRAEPSENKRARSDQWTFIARREATERWPA
jgi:acetyl/propionyl-CoA carboxylase alpha subunit